MNRFIAFVEFDLFGRRTSRFLRGAGAKSRPTYLHSVPRYLAFIGRRVNWVVEKGAYYYYSTFEFRSIARPYRYGEKYTNNW